MGLPKTESKFPGSCKKCKVEYGKGAIIYKINEDYWCSNPNCPGVEAKEGPKTTSSPVDLEAKLDQIWEIAYAKANKIMEEEINQTSCPDALQRQKQKLIMAQTFVKALCGCND